MKALLGLTRFRPRMTPILAGFYWLGIGVSMLVLLILLILLSPLALWDWFVGKARRAAGVSCTG